MRPPPHADLHQTERDVVDRRPFRLRRTTYDPQVWDRILESQPKAELFHTPAWLEYLKLTQGIEPVLASVMDGESRVGYFVGGTVSRFGFRVLGSPLTGWGTDVMGFLLEEGVDRQRAVAALPTFAYRELGCVHVELGDRYTRLRDFDGTPFTARPSDAIIVDIGGSDEEILSNMQSRTRTYVRRAERTGLSLEEAHGVGFADEYYDQLLDVFASSGLTPTYGIERVRTLIEILEPTGHLLLMRVRDPDGHPIATSITIGTNGRALLWGLAHYRASRSLHAVEPLQYATMRAWRERGLTRYDLAGTNTAKAKFGGDLESLVRAHHSRFAIMESGRSAVRRLFYARQRARGRFAEHRRGTARDDAGASAD